MALSSLQSTANFHVRRGKAGCLIRFWLAGAASLVVEATATRRLRHARSPLSGHIARHGILHSYLKGLPPVGLEPDLRSDQRGLHTAQGFNQVC